MSSIFKKSFFVAFCFVEKHLYTKFQKISSNGLDFANFLHFRSILAVFWLKNGQKRRNPKRFFVAFIFVGKQLHTKIQKISSNGLEFAVFFIFGQFWLFFG